MEPRRFCIAILRFAYSELRASIPIAVCCDMSTATVSRINTQTYTGEAIKPEFTVTMTPGETMTLREGADYTVKWENNVNKGTATGALAKEEAPIRAFL